jgi:hypothetical protein
MDFFIFRIIVDSQWRYRNQPFRHLQRESSFNLKKRAQRSSGITEPEPSSDRIQSFGVKTQWKFRFEGEFDKDSQNFPEILQKQSNILPRAKRFGKVALKRAKMLVFIEIIDFRTTSIEECLSDLSKLIQFIRIWTPRSTAKLGFAQSGQVVIKNFLSAKLLWLSELFSPFSKAKIDQLAACVCDFDL